MMGDPFGLAIGKVRQEELLREAEQRRIARALWRFRRGEGDDEGPVEHGGFEVRWGLAGDEPAVAELLELNGMPRWISFEERFLVAERDGKILGAVRYRTESKRLILGLLVVDPWAHEDLVAPALYRGAGELAREIGVREVVASTLQRPYSARAGYRRRGRRWLLDVGRLYRTDNRRGPLRGTLKS